MPSEGLKPSHQPLDEDPSSNSSVSSISSSEESLPESAAYDNQLNDFLEYDVNSPHKKPDNRPENIAVISYSAGSIDKPSDTTPIDALPRFHPEKSSVVVLKDGLQNLFSKRSPTARRISEASFTSTDSNAMWNEDFSHRPSWCDAKMTLKQIKRGKATGNRAALCVRSLLQCLLFKIGCKIQKYCYQVLCLGLIVMGLCMLGLRQVEIETDIVRLWVEKGGRLDDELNFLNNIKKKTESLAVLGSGRNSADDSPMMTPETGLSGGFQVVIGTPRQPGLNILTQEDLLLHADVLTNVSQMAVEMYGERWTLADLCFKPPAPQVELGSMTDVVQNLLDKIIPCVFITPLDCYWDGAKPLGPFPPIDLGDLSMFFSSLPNGGISWKNLHPNNIIKDLKILEFNLGLVEGMFSRAGIDAAYQDRPCIDPLDPECPKLAPNNFDLCAATVYLVNYTRQQREEDRLFPIKNTSKRDYDYYGTTTTQDDEYDYEDYFGIFTSPKEEKHPDCEMYNQTVVQLLRTHRDQVEAILPEHLRLRIADFGKEMTGGCKSFASAVLNWPEDLIVGGVKHDSKNQISKAEALQSVLMVSGSQDVFVRFKNNPVSKPQLNQHYWTPEAAQEIIDAWERNFTRLVYDWPNNTQGEERQVHPLAGTSVGDMLDEFSKFNPMVIIGGYILMIIYSGLSLCSCRERGVQSCMGLGIAGVLVVTFASASGLGLSTVMGIKFNAATTQIVPFLTLGLGVDDMFLLVHNYKEIVLLTHKHELGYLLKETGLSVLLTSVNNIMAFCAGGLLPVPALRNFCIQTAILLVFNMFGILSIFPALMSVDLKRRKSKRMDIFCCIDHKDKVHTEKDKYAEMNRSDGAPQDPQPPTIYDDTMVSSVGQNGSVVSNGTALINPDKKPHRACMEVLGIQHWTLHHFVKHVYAPFLKNTAVKVGVLLFSLCLLGAGVVGLTKVVEGLELTDVIPKGTAPYAFLQAREKYFSFYPVYAVVEGPIDFPVKQNLIREYREAIDRCHYTVTNQDGARVVNGIFIRKLGEQYWLSLMTEWLLDLQMKYDEAWRKKLINSTYVSKLASDEAALAYKLICNAGRKVECSRNGIHRLVDTRAKDGFATINEEGFYNYMTAWYNQDPMMYYISQASFYPTPPKWSNEKGDDKVPAAEPPMYSQLPFFLNGLVDTPATVDAIRQIRAICDSFAARGLPNFPQGVPFTFWEQYLHLRSNLLMALGIITACVFVVITLLLMSPWTAAIVVSVLVVMVVELAGFMGIFGLKLNPVSAVSLITAVGIGVEFTVHISLSYLSSLGSRNERMERTLDHMFIPVVHGGISTLLGIIMLSFSEFEFIVRYFFMVMSALIVIGLLNGLVLLPVLLSIIGPKSEVQTTDGSNLLQPPSPRPKHRGPLFSHRSHDDGYDLQQVHCPQLQMMQRMPNGVRQGSAANYGHSPNGFRRHSSGTRHPSGGAYRHHESLSTINEESTPPSSCTPPAGPQMYTVGGPHAPLYQRSGSAPLAYTGAIPLQAAAPNNRTYQLNPVQVVVHTGGAPVGGTGTPRAHDRRQVRSMVVDASALDSPAVTVKAKAKVKVQMHSAPPTPT